MSILEAMSEARPVVSIWVGGVPDVAKGGGIVTPPGNMFALSMGVTMLLRSLIGRGASAWRGDSAARGVR